jgi:hypothetical protein
MASALIFAEDDAQEKFVGTLTRRLCAESGLELDLRIRSAQGGFASMLNELQGFRMAWRKGTESLPDALIVAADANCRGLSECKKQIDARLVELTDWSLQAIADPHIERWLLLDGHAFQQVLGRGCAAPDQKCEKGHYKNLLARAVREAGIRPLFGGIEFAEDLAKRLDVARCAQQDRGFANFIQAFNAFTRRLKSAQRPPSP